MPSNTTVQQSDEVDLLKQRIRDLEAVLKQRDPRISTVFRLSTSQSNLLGLLMALPNVTPEIIRQRLEIATDSRVAMHRLRAHLKDWGIKIESRRNVGYWLEREMKDKIRGIVAATIAEENPPEDMKPEEGNTGDTVAA